MSNENKVDDVDDANKMLEESLSRLSKVVSDKPGGEDRPQQRRMIEAVCAAVSTSTPVMVEAGTGSGKSFAELIPASVFATSEKRWVLSTATIQLSEQLGKVDLPFLGREIPGLDGTWSVLKGRSNYLCRERTHKVRSEDEESRTLFNADESETKKTELPKEAQELSALLDWEDSPECDGDRGNGPAVSDKVWAQTSRTSSTCPGADKCPFGGDCFAEKAIESAKHSRIVISNHALVAHDLMKRADDGIGVFGENVDVIVFDESHQLESYLSEAWGSEVGIEWGKDVVSQMRSILGNSGKDITNSFKEHVDDLVKSAVVECQKSGGKSMLIPPSSSWPTLVQESLNVLEHDITEFSYIPVSDANGKSSQKRLANMLSDLFSRLGDNSERTVRWVEYDSMEWKKGAEPVARLKTAPLMVGEMLSQITDDLGITPIFTSATIRVNGGFKIPSEKLGVPAANGVDLGSPFSFGRQGILCIPDDIPVPKGDDREKHFKKFQKMSLEIVKALGGRTLILCTSKKNTVKMKEFLSSKGVDVVDTVDTPQAQAASAFKENASTVLVGTYGVWQGLDVPGDSLQAVLIEKIPFDRVDDMLVSARSRHWDENGGSGFMLESIANAQTRLNQAVGRLIRSKSDKGIVVIADPRMKTTRYGSTLTNGLPPFYRLDDFNALVKSCRNLSSAR